jgi:hypothetical protein
MGISVKPTHGGCHTLRAKNTRSACVKVLEYSVVMSLSLSFRAYRPRAFSGPTGPFVGSALSSASWRDSGAGSSASVFRFCRCFFIAGTPWTIVSAGEGHARACADLASATRRSSAAVGAPPMILTFPNILNLMSTAQFWWPVRVLST